MKILNRLFPKPKPKPAKKIYTSYSEALADCTQEAYEEKELIEVIFKKTKKFIIDLEKKPIPVWEQPAYGIIAMLPFIKQETINVLDFGGACGAHYFHTRKLIDCKINWHVIETPGMVAMAKELESDELKFSSDLSEVRGSFDLIHTSGALQCVDDPFKYLKQLLALDFPLCHAQDGTI